MLDGRVKTMHPLHPGRHPRPARPARAHEDHRRARHQADRPGRHQPLSVRGGRFAARRRRADGRSRTSTSAAPRMIRAAAKNHGDEEHGGVAVVTDPATTTVVLDEMRDHDGVIGYEVRRKLATKAFQTTAHYDTVIANWFSEMEERASPATCCATTRRSWSSRTARTRTSAPPTTRRAGSRQPPAQPGHPAARQEAVVQQPLRPGTRRARLADEFKLPCVRDHQAQQPLRLRPGRLARARLPEGLRLRPGERLRVGRSPSTSKVDVATGRSHGRAVHRGAVRARLRRRGARDPHRQEGHPRAARRRAPPLNPGEFDYKRVLGGLLVQDKDDDLEERDEHGGRHRTGIRPTPSGTTCSSPSGSPSTSSPTPS